jgi:hypothetical protein
MTFVIIFALGYGIGGAAALLVFGLALAGRKDQADRHVSDLVTYDAEHYSL